MNLQAVLSKPAQSPADPIVQDFSTLAFTEMMTCTSGTIKKLILDCSYP